MRHQTVLRRSTLDAIYSAGCLLADLVWPGYVLTSPKVMLGGPAGTLPATGSVSHIPRGRDTREGFFQKGGLSHVSRM